MPLTKGQISALTAIAAARDLESYVAGSTPLNSRTQRYSADIDIFHDREERVAAAAEADAQTLAAAGFSIEWRRRSGGVHSLTAERDGETVKLEWVADSDYRFFPATPDPLFGFVLHPVDLAVNKALAAANRREVRDLIDLAAFDRLVLPLGAILWAAADKSPGFTPEGLIGEIRRNSAHPREAWAAVLSSEPIDPDDTIRRLRAALEDALHFVSQMPTDMAGLIFFDKDRVVQPDPAALARYTAHRAQRRGHWPSDPEIAAAMLERYRSGWTTINC